jgi:hypothetical protein
MNLNNLKEVFQSLYHIPNPDVIDIVSGTILANSAKDEPVWLVLIGPPGSMKTQIAGSAATASSCKLLNQLTEKTLVSGFNAGKKGNQSLLPKLTIAGITTVVNLDLSNIFSMRHEKREEIMAQFRQIYDGKLTGNYGTGEEVVWNGFMGFLGCSTEEIDKYHGSIVKLGDRFLFYRMPRLDDGEVIEAVERNSGKRRAVLTTTEKAYKEFLDGGEWVHPSSVKVSEEIWKILREIAIFCSKIRTPLSWDKGRTGFSFIPSPESPSRIYATMRSLITGIAGANNRCEVNRDDLRHIYKIASDSLPPQRLNVLRALQRGLKRIRDISKNVNMSDSSAYYRLMELKVLKLVKQDDSKDWTPTKFCLFL